VLESRVCRFTKYEESTNSSFSAWKYIVTARLHMPYISCTICDQRRRLRTRLNGLPA